MKSLYDFSHLPVDRTISPLDTMLAEGKETEYYDIGRRALELIHFSSILCDKPHYPDILDLPCGYGRVLRWIRAHYNYARITACDLERTGVDFCRERFGAIPLYSEPDLNRLPLCEQFDLIWVGSLLTHLPREKFLSTLENTIRWTRDCGVIILSVQGRYFATQLGSERPSLVDTIDKKSLLADFKRDGFAYTPYTEMASSDYGISLTSPEWLMRVLQRHPNVIIRAYLEQAWGMQDVVILYKKNGFNLPTLGDITLNPMSALTEPAPPLVKKRWFGRKG